MITSRTPSTNRPTPSAAVQTSAPDAHRLQAQLAELAESVEPIADRSLPRLLEYLRALLAARTVAFLPVSPDVGTNAVVAGMETPGLVRLGEALDGHKTQVIPAPAFGANAYNLAVPVRRGNQLSGWLVAQMEIAQSRDLQAFAVLLQTFSGYLLYRSQLLAGVEVQRALESASGLLDVFRQSGQELDFNIACRLALDGLCRHLQCDRISLGFRRHRALHVTAISNIATVDPKSPSHQPCEAAMNEALRAGKEVDWSSASVRKDVTVAHEILAEKTGSARILTLPLPRARGALLLEWFRPMDPATEPIVDAAAPFVPVLFDLLDRARPNALVFAIQRLWKKAGMKRRLALSIGAGAALVLMVWPFHYHVGADCRVTPLVRQVVAAPFDGQLRKSFVRPGDAVQAGDPLGELDNRELKMKEAELTASRDRALKERDRAMAGGAKGDGADFAAAQSAGFEAQSVSRELELIRRKLSMLKVVAPLSGVVVSSDLRRAEGQPVPRGEVLWEVAPLDAMIVEMDVPDREISRLRVGQSVRVRLEAFGGGHWDTTIRRIYAQSEQREGKNIFVVEADVANSKAAELRPGMRGRASIETDRHPLIWIIGHRFWAWLTAILFW